MLLSIVGVYNRVVFCFIQHACGQAQGASGIVNRWHHILLVLTHLCIHMCHDRPCVDGYAGSEPISDVPECLLGCDNLIMAIAIGS